MRFSTCFISLILFVSSTALAQNSDSTSVKLKTRILQADSTHRSTELPLQVESVIDSIPEVVGEIAESDTAQTDSIVPAPKNDALESEVTYSATDSIQFDVKTKMVYLYGDAEILYEDIVLKAEYIEVDQETKEVFAKGLADSTGKVIGEPVFSQGEDEFEAETMRYNFDTKKGRITEVITHEGDGHLHGEVVKKSPEDHYFIKQGGYTTCDQDVPHFLIASKKLKVIPNDKIVSGPAYLSIEGVPTPLVLPFGFFPNKQGQKSGLLLPEYGESPAQGFFLRNGGYYFALGETIDLAVRGDVYTTGSYGVRLNSAYKKRYRYNGSIELSHNSLRNSDPEFPDFSVQNNFFVRWRHTQDPKARPSTSFNANVNAGTSTAFNNSLTTNTGDFLRNTFTSSIAFQKTWPGKPFSFNASMSHNQNTLTKEVNVTLPQLAFSVNRIYPFRRREAVGKQRWYEKIGMSYQMRAENRISAIDSVFFTQQTLNSMQNGISHSIPINTSFKAFKYFTIAPSANYNERWFFQRLDRGWDNELQEATTDTVTGFFSNRDFNAGVNVNTTIYGLLPFKKGAIAGIRHVMNPRIGFTWRPKMGDDETVYAGTNGAVTTYSPDQLSIYGRPPTTNSGNITFGVNNNLEIKIRTPKDTVNETKKIKLLEAFSIAGSYNLFADSLNLSDFTFAGRTRILEKFNVNFSWTMTPYVTDSTGRRFDRFLISESKELLHLTRANLAVSFNLNGKSRSAAPKTSGRATEEELAMIQANPQAFIDFDVPWNLFVSYNLNYNDFATNKVTQTLQFSGDLSITPKWKVSFSSGYDFVNKDLTQTNIGIHRDLHCWEFRFNWVPFGTLQSWTLDLNVKAPVLQDLKLTRRRDWYDYQ